MESAAIFLYIIIALLTMLLTIYIYEFVVMTDTKDAQYKINVILKGIGVLTIVIAIFATAYLSKYELNNNKSNWIKTNSIVQYPSPLPPTRVNNPIYLNENPHNKINADNYSKIISENSNIHFMEEYDKNRLIEDDTRLRVNLGDKNSFT